MDANLNLPNINFKLNSSLLSKPEAFRFPPRNFTLLYTHPPAHLPHTNSISPAPHTTSRSPAPQNLPLTFPTLQSLKSLDYFKQNLPLTCDTNSPPRKPLRIPTPHLTAVLLSTTMPLHQPYSNPFLPPLFQRSVFHRPLRPRWWCIAALWGALTTSVTPPPPEAQNGPLLFNLNAYHPWSVLGHLATNKNERAGVPSANGFSPLNNASTAAAKRTRHCRRGRRSSSAVSRVGKEQGDCQ